MHLRTVFRAATLVMGLFIASRVLGLVREAVIAYQFGLSGQMDAYLAAFRLPDFLFYVVSGGALGSAFIPVFAEYLTRRDMEGAWRLASAVINTVWLMLTLLGGLMAVFAPTLVSLLYPDLSPTLQTLTVELMRWMLISTVIFGVSGIVMGILNAQQHFLLPALAPVIYNVGIIFGAAVLGPTWGVRGLVAGGILGAAGHLLVQLPGLVAQRMRFQWLLGWSDAGLRQVIQLMLPRMAGIAAVQLNFVVTTILAAGLSTGSITALNYGWIIMLLPQGVIAQSVATALFPTLSALAADNKRAEMRHVFGSTLRGLLFLTLPAAAGLVVWSAPIIRLLLERGEFDSASTEMTQWALSLFALGLVGHAVVEIGTRAFYALKNTVTPVIITILTVLLNIGLSLLLIRLFSRLALPPHGGLALANSIAITVEMVVLLWLLRPQMGGVVDSGFRVALSKMLLATGGMSVLLLLLPPAETWWFSLIGIGLGGGVYLALAMLLRLPEMVQLRQRILRR